jgi:NADP-dependent 3-hydroxy acid dehydrogenase YdfG
MNSGQRIFLTGASSGIGQATAQALLTRGHRVYGVARRGEELAQNAEQWKDLPGEWAWEVADVRDPDSIRAAVTHAVERWGGLDAVVPNAGLGYFDPLPQARLEDWLEMVDINIKGVLNTLHAALPHVAQAKGTVVNIGSLAARQVFPNSGVYCATKHAVLALSESIRLEYRDTIGVTTINPGAVNTPFIDQTPNAELRATYRPQFDAGMAPEFVADSIVLAIESKGRGVFSEITLRPDNR